MTDETMTAEDVQFFKDWGELSTSKETVARILATYAECERLRAQLAAATPEYVPPDNAVDVGRTLAQWGTR